MQANAFRLIAAVAVIALLSFLQTRLNLRRSRRGRQVLLPVLAAVFSAIAILVLTLRQDWAQSICGANEILAGGNIVVLNVLLMLAFLLFKCIACPLVSARWKSNKVMELTAAGFYAYDEVYGEWFLQARWADFRRVIRVLALCAWGLSILLLAATWLAGPGSAVWGLYFPCAALLVLNECWCFLNGQTREEFVHTVLGDAADARKVGNFYRIREIYEKLFTPQMLASHTGCEFAARQGSTTLLESMAASDDPVEHSVATFYQTYGEKIPFDTDSIQATSRLMHRENVIFFNPFYRDIGPYLTLPLVNALLKGKKCLVIAGRSSSGEDAVEWLSELLRRYAHLRSLWRVSRLGNKVPECEVGVLTFQQLYDVDVLAVNRPFFAETDFVLLLEPSAMVNTGQVGLSIIAEEASRYDDDPVYCICDRYTDGLVDTMSHLLHAEITNVSAMPVPRCVYTGMAWDATGDFIRQRLFDKQTKFLGNGIELAAVAVKNQVPQVTWYAETKAPLRDVKWIAGQYYATICRYMNLPTQQKSLYEKIKFVPNLWCTKSTKEQFILAEDEFCNMFTMMRAFLSRGEDQAFVNILSENYLLRDYMRCNQQMFLANPNAIPSLAPDYAKTERNTLLKLVILMSIRPVAEREIADELRLAGCVVEDAFETLSGLLRKYTQADGSILDIKSVNESADTLAARTVNYFTLSRQAFDAYFASSLKNAYYIVEDEKRDTEFIDAKLFGHVTQTILPGQGVVYDGKYYQVRSISPKNGIILRRASDLYSARRYYRQDRTYALTPTPGGGVLYARKTMGVELTIANYDFSVVTTGYLDMPDSHDLRLARLVDFGDDPAVENYTRRYKNKNVLRIKLPDTDDKIRFTLSMLLSEVFRSVFPEAWQYLAVMAKRPENIGGMLNYMVYSLEGDVADDEIYVVEDSDLDLGLLDAVNRSLPQLLDIVADFLDWHFEKMSEPEAKDPVPVQIKVKPEEVKRRNLFLRMADRIRRLFDKKEAKVEIAAPEEAETAPTPEPAPAAPVAPAPAPAPGEAPEETPAAEEGEGDYVLDGAPAEEAEKPVAPPPEEDAGEVSLEEPEPPEEEQPVPAAVEEPQPQPQPQPQPESAQPEDAHPEDALEPEENGDADLVHIDGSDIFETEGVPETDLELEDAFRAIGIAPLEQSRYQRECFLKFGFEEIDARLKIEEVQKYLHVRGFSHNALTLARTCEVLDKNQLDFEATNFCDFCGVPLSGVSYERLNDGRIRCNDCSASAISTVDEFRGIFYRALEMMELFYGVSIHVPISVRMADARTIAKGVGMIFRPSTQVAARVLGFAQRKGSKYSVFLENGSPRLAAIETMVHELTHIWQYLNWNRGQVEQIYGMPQKKCTARARDIVYEGMAVWASIQYLYQIGENYYAAQQEAQSLARKDVYGLGYRLFAEQYPIVKDMSLLKYSPFTSFPPLEPADVKQAARLLCTEKECGC